MKIEILGGDGNLSRLPRQFTGNEGLEAALTGPGPARPGDRGGRCCRGAPIIWGFSANFKAADARKLCRAAQCALREHLAALRAGGAG